MNKQQREKKYNNLKKTVEDMKKRQKRRRKRKKRKRGREIRETYVKVESWLFTDTASLSFDFDIELSATYAIILEISK